MDVAVALPVGVAVGLVLGLLGAGGSLLTVPALIFLLGLSTSQATGTSLVAVALMATAGVAVHGPAGRCSCREGATFGAAAAVVAVGAGAIASVLPDRVLSGAFVVLLVGTAIWMVRGNDEALADRGGGRAGVVAIGGAGAGVGALTGLLGVGGGFLIVPALVGLRGMPMPLAVGTSQLVVLISAVAGLVGRLTGDSVQWGLGLLFGIGGVVGATAGSKLGGRVPADRLRLGFATVAVLVALTMAWQVVAGGHVAG